MKAGRFLRDKVPYIMIDAVTLILSFIFFLAFRAPVSEIIIISLIFILGRTLVWLADYWRKRNFYTTLSDNTSGLDKKYLVSETLERPAFYEGELTYDVLADAGKAMREEVVRYQNDYAEFKNYIELWVHEIKLPVASLLLTCHNEEDGGKKYIPQLKRVDEYIENVLFYARSENAEKDYLITGVSLKRVFADAAVKAREELQLREVSIETEGLDTEVFTDAKWLEFIFGQLLSNSMKYLKEGRPGVIRVSAVDSGNEIRLSFTDNGVGIPAADLPRIFDKSFTGQNGRLRARSTGMGLYIVKTLCERLGHRISADSEEGEYTTVTIAFGKDPFAEIR